jgi:D-alanyl-D-alanine carboxypeptidase (penicillin-binding protein 5/6)
MKGIPILIACLMLCGCTQREELDGAYEVFDTSATYQLTGSTAQKEASLMAENLCVGGTTNTASDDVDADFAESAAVFSIDDQEITYAQNIYEKRYPASTTKILTAYLALKYGDLNDTITVSEDAINSLPSGSSTCGLQIGDQITLDQLLYGLMLRSGNDAANVIAEYISGSSEAFAELMNQEAISMGATHSHFVNPHGFHDEEHYTTAYDLYLIFNTAITDERFVNYISTKSYQASYLNASGEAVDVLWQNTNGYLKGSYEAPENVVVVGGKTGTTNAAGSCLVLYSLNQDQKPVISIVLKSDSSDHLYTLMTEMLANFSN